MNTVEFLLSSYPYKVVSPKWGLFYCFYLVKLRSIHFPKGGHLIGHFQVVFAFVSKQVSVQNHLYGNIFCQLVQFHANQPILISGGTKIWPHPLNTRQSEAVTVSLIFPLLCPLPSLPTGNLYSPQFRSHQETKMAAHWTKRSVSTITQKNRNCEQSINWGMRTHGEQDHLT